MNANNIFADVSFFKVDVSGLSKPMPAENHEHDVPSYCNLADIAFGNLLRAAAILKSDSYGFPTQGYNVFLDSDLEFYEARLDFEEQGLIAKSFKNVYFGP